MNNVLPGPCADLTQIRNSAQSAGSRPPSGKFSASGAAIVVSLVDGARVSNCVRSAPRVLARPLQFADARPYSRWLSTCCHSVEALPGLWPLRNHSLHCQLKVAHRLLELSYV